MNREQAMKMVLAEAFSENGLAALANDGGDPGWDRMNTLIGMLSFLMEELANDDSFSREFVSALFVLGSHVPDLLRMRDPEHPHFRPSLIEQAFELTVAVTAIIENWNHWPDWETHELRTYRFASASKESEESSHTERVGGYAVGDITYCEIPGTAHCFPVQVERLGNGCLDVAPLGDVPGMCAGFVEEDANRRFFLPRLSPGARFGADDERPVNSKRKSGPELRLLSLDFATTTHHLIRERFATDPVGWPLPTGLLLDRWFNDLKPRHGDDP